MRANRWQLGLDTTSRGESSSLQRVQKCSLHTAHAASPASASPHPLLVPHPLTLSSATSCRTRSRSFTCSDDLNARQHHRLSLAEPFRETPAERSPLDDSLPHSPHHARRIHPRPRREPRRPRSSRSRPPHVAREPGNVGKVLKEVQGGTARPDRSVLLASYGCRGCLCAPTGRRDGVLSSPSRSGLTPPC